MEADAGSRVTQNGGYDENENSEEEEYVKNIIQCTTRSGRKPKPTQVYKPEVPVKKRRQKKSVLTVGSDRPVPSQQPVFRKPSPTRRLPSVERIMRPKAFKPRVVIPKGTSVHSPVVQRTGITGTSIPAASNEQNSSGCSDAMLGGESPLSPGQLVFVRGQSDDPESQV